MPTILTTGNLSDILYLVPSCKAMGGNVELDVPMPLSDDVLQFLEYQEGILEVIEVHSDGIRRDHDLTNIRQFLSYAGTIAEAQRQLCSPFNVVDFSKPWIKLKGRIKKDENLIVIGRSIKDHNPEWERIWPDVLKRYPQAVFVGTEEEHANFCAKCGIITRVDHSEDIQIIAKVIAESSLFIGNQGLAYALAEGFKVNSIQETINKECTFPRENAKYIKTEKEWFGSFQEQKLLLALQFFPAEVPVVKDLCELLVDNEPRRRQDCEFALVPRYDCETEDVREMHEILSKRFKVKIIHQLQGLRSKGWPYGCNDLWRGLMLQIAGLMPTDYKGDCTAVLTFEADCIPLRQDWISCLLQEWQRVSGARKLCFGTYHDSGGPNGIHLNGNGVFDILFAKKLICVQRAPVGGWDVAYAKQIIPESVDSKFIIMRYAERGDVPFSEIASIRKGDEIPALLHGIKSDCGRKWVREMIDTGWKREELQTLEVTKTELV